MYKALCSIFTSSTLNNHLRLVQHNKGNLTSSPLSFSVLHPIKPLRHTRNPADTIISFLLIVLLGDQLLALFTRPDPR
jgi:hypothetical protein